VEGGDDELVGGKGKRDGNDELHRPVAQPALHAMLGKFGFGIRHVALPLKQKGRAREPARPVA